MALAAYEMSLSKAPRTDSIYDLIDEQISLLKSGSEGVIVPIRNPGIE